MGLKTQGDDIPTWALAMRSDEAKYWREAAHTEMQNFERHGVFVEVSEDPVLLWNSHSKRASEMTDMMRVLRKEEDEKGNLLKYKTRAVMCGNQQKQKALASGDENTLDTFASAARRSLPLGRVSRATTKKVYVRPLPDKRFFDDRGVPIIYKLLKSLSGEADAGRIWHCTAKKQLINVQRFTQSEFDPRYFYKKYADGHRVDLVLHVDDCWMADTGSKQADNDLRIFRDRFKLTMQDKTKQFLGICTSTLVREAW
eukprot:6196492-Pleurochrysis_carterae.AAC.2